VPSIEEFADNAPNLKMIIETIKAPKPHQSQFKFVFGLFTIFSPKA